MSLQGLIRSDDPISVLIVQNEALLTLADLPGRFPDLDIILRLEPRIGLCHVRNRLFDEAEALGADWFIGVDDDEWVEPGWLAVLLRHIQSAPARTMFFGPCIYHYDSSRSRFVEPSQIPETRSDQPPPLMPTHNYAVPSELFSTGRGRGLRFDLNYNQTGGEDYEFFHRAVSLFDFKGVWLPDAVVHEERVGNRGTFRFRLTHRRRNIANELRTDIDHARLAGKAPPLLGVIRPAALINRNLIYGLGEVMSGAFQALIARPAASETIGNGISRLYSIIGVFDYLLGRRHVHYGADKVQDNTVVTMGPGPKG